MNDNDFNLYDLYDCGERRADGSVYWHDGMWIRPDGSVYTDDSQIHWKKVPESSIVAPSGPQTSKEALMPTTRLAIKDLKTDIPPGDKPRNFIEVDVDKSPKQNPYVSVRAVTRNAGVTGMSVTTSSTEDTVILDDIAPAKVLTEKKRQQILDAEMANHESRTWQAIRKLCQDRRFQLL